MEGQGVRVSPSLRARTVRDRAVSVRVVRGLGVCLGSRDVVESVAN